ncbi:MAG TPA: hypothetical protein VHN79_07940 [Lacunisphaera sp.]|nr:hypothetical protein [Lacunisphaera sp.]
MLKKITASIVLSCALAAPSVLAQAFKSTVITALRPLKVAKFVEVTPGRDYDLEGYGLMFGLHVGSDEGSFTYRAIKGDFDVSVRMESVHNDDKAFTEAGLMARKSRHPSDLMVGQSVTTNQYEGDADQYTFMRRTRFGGFLYDAAPKDLPGGGGLGNADFSYQARGYQKDNSGKAGGKTRPFPHVWLRLKREGDTYTGWCKEGVDGEWKQVGTTTVDLGEEPLVGIFISANHHSVSSTWGNPTSRAFVQFRDLTGFPVSAAQP